MIRRPFDHSAKVARGELADEAAAERLEALYPEAALRRREFLARTAALAGAAGMASFVSTESLVAEAARRARRRPFPSPRNLPIDTFVVLMMENRSFDHYFGWHPRADAKNVGLAYPAPDGSRIPTYRLSPDFQGCGHPDPDHGWTGGRFQWNGGRNDGFVFGNEDGTSSDEFAIGYYLKEDLGFIPHVADAFTLYDRWFCSIMASTYPNRHYQWGAQNGGQKSNVLPPESEEPIGFTWETIMDRAEANGVSFTYYNSDLPFSGLYGLRGLAQTQPIATFYAQAASGTLPNICFVDPPFRDGGGGDGLSADEHPHGDIRLGQAFMSDVVHAFIESPQYERAALFINYDEWGGFFDHVPPPFVPDARRNVTDIDNDWGFTGFRIPGVAVSPYARGGRVSHMTVTHESILKLISYKFGLGYLNKRHRYASNIGRSFDFRKPDLEPPTGIPDPTAILAIPCSLQGNGAGQRRRAKPHDLVELETSGYLDRLGFDIPDASVDRIFREPDSVRQAYEGSKQR
ncbi:MAG: phospholipase [Actinomycetota bacterium]|nr:phospholipase [Actinomycetota bacterium]